MKILNTKYQNQGKDIFSVSQLKNMIIPLFMEQILVMMVGIADTLVVSYAGEAAVSGVSLVNQFNTIFIYLFSALAAGGSVVISQYLGRKEKDNAGEAASQLLMFSTVFSVVIMALVLILKLPLLNLLFGDVEPEVMEASDIYFWISALSFPAIAVYNAGAAVYRSIGRTSVTMTVSVISNIINVIGNVIGVFALHSGVYGVAWASLIARYFSAIVITYMCTKPTNEVQYKNKWIFKWNGKMMGSMLKIAIPNGAESGVFQIVKVALASMLAMFGTYQIAAYGVAQSIWGLAAVSGIAMSTVYITVIGQCMGAGDIPAAEYYFKWLTKITLIISIAWNVLTFVLTPVFLMAYSLSSETKTLVIWLVLIHNAFNAFVFPFSSCVSSGLRATGDVKYTMYVTIGATILGRLVLSWIFAVLLGWGVIGLSFAMVADWSIRAVLFVVRQRQGKWKSLKVI